MDKEYRLCISGKDVTHLLAHCDANRTFTAPSTMEVFLNCEGASLASTYLGGVITLEIEYEGAFVPYFHGFVIRASVEQLRYHIYCIDRMRLFQEAQLGSAPGPGIHPSEQIFYLIASIDPEHVSAENLPYDANQKLADQKWLFQRRRYVFIAPLPFCRLEVEDINLANAHIYTLQGEGGRDDRNIAQSHFGDVPVEWSAEVPRIRFYVMAEGFLDAFERGRAHLRQLLDILSFGANSTAPCYQLSGEYHFLNFDRDRLLASIQETEWAYVRDTMRPDRYWLRWYQPHRSGQPFTLSASFPTFALSPLFAPLLGSEAETLPNDKRSILNALHALRQSRQAASTLDSLIQLFNCVEFLVSGQPIPALFEEEDRAKLVKAALKAVDEIYANSSKAERGKRSDRVRSILNDQLNSPSLKTKWILFCQKYNVDVTKEENDLIWKTLRSGRNHHQHGRLASADRSNLDKASNILERVILVAMDAEPTSSPTP